MKVALWFAFQAAFLAIYVIMVAELGLVAEAFTGPCDTQIEQESSECLSEPNTGTGIIDVFKDAIKWVVDATKFFAKLITFQLVGMPAALGIPIAVLMSTINLYLVYRAIRSGTAI